VNEDAFNLDLTLIEKWLKRDDSLYVLPAMKMPDTVAKPVARDTLFVLSLDEVAEPDQEIGGDDVTQLVRERFGVLIAVNARGSYQGVAGRDPVRMLRERVKFHLTGLVIDDFEPIAFDAGKLIDANTKTQNLLYQVQFVTSRTVVTGVKFYDE
jgi:hypothetical protein